MSSSLPDSLLAIDVGEITTRAALFDVVDSRYRFLACGAAPSTVNAPYHHAGEGVRRALEHLQSITGRVLVGPDERLILPSGIDGSGVDTVAATLSAGPPINVVVVGLLEDISLESARRLAVTTYSRVVEEFSLNDRRTPEARLDAILRLRPDLVIAAGGTDGGASQSVLKLLESVGLASYLVTTGGWPEVLFAGNSALQEEVKASLSKFSPLRITSNIRPTLGVEQLDRARTDLSDLFRRIRIQQIPGIHDLDELAGGGLLPTAHAFGRMIRFLSKVYTSTKGVLGIDLGASAATVAGSFEGELTLGVYPQYGLGAGLADLLAEIALGEITRWLAVPVPEDVVRDYLQMKAIYPSTLPFTAEDLALEQALARVLIQAAVRKTVPNFPGRVFHSGTGLLPWFEPVVASGSVLTRAPSRAQSLLMLLDGLQPAGVTTVVLDQYHLVPSLGAAAAANPVLAVQILESSTFMNLGTVITPVVKAQPGTPVLRIRMADEGGNETRLDVKQGALEVLPLPIGQTAKLRLQPLHRAEIGMGGAGRGGSLRVVGSELGVIIDARGRPLRLPDDHARRQELLKKWLWNLGG